MRVPLFLIIFFTGVSCSFAPPKDIQNSKPKEKKSKNPQTQPPTKKDQEEPEQESNPPEPSVSPQSSLIKTNPLPLSEPLNSLNYPLAIPSLNLSSSFLNTEGVERDFDGDFFSDREEAARGTNPRVADLPDLRTRFIQNYAITVNYKIRIFDEEPERVITIESKIHKTDPDYNYRVGDVFIRNESFKNAAAVGKISGHGWGEIEEHDLSWVSYPEIDSTFLLDKVLSVLPIFYTPPPSEKEHLFLEENSVLIFKENLPQISSITVMLENSIRLKENSGFKNIKNPVLNFRYYNYETESYELLDAVTVERHFNAGINETFEVILENIPESLIVENYLKRGEFIISEVYDYEIPELETTYRTLLASVRAHSIPVVFNTPRESKTSYVGTGKETSFTKILHSLFGSEYIVRENVLTKINQFENNLPIFTYLEEIKDRDKQGRWFVFTNELNTHFLDYKFSPKDVIALSYVTGDILADQVEEKVFSYKKRFGSFENHLLGNISSNSVVHIQLSPNIHQGEKINSFSHTVRSERSNEKNAWSPEVTCRFDVNFFYYDMDDFTFSKDFTGEFEKIFLVIGTKEFSLKQLIAEEHIIPRFINDNIHLTVSDLFSIEGINSGEEYRLELKIVDFKATTFNGLKLSKMEGRDSYECPVIAVNTATENDWPLSVESKNLNEWEHFVDWNRTIRGENKTTTEGFNVNIGGMIVNKFN